jgi:hypothetical protein
LYGVFRNELACPVVTGWLGAHLPCTQVGLPAQVGGRHLRIDAAIVHVLAAVGLFGHAIFWDELHGYLLGQASSDVKTYTVRCAFAFLVALACWLLPRAVPF